MIADLILNMRDWLLRRTHYTTIEHRKLLRHSKERQYVFGWTAEHAANVRRILDVQTFVFKEDDSAAFGPGLMT